MPTPTLSELLTMGDGSDFIALTEEDFAGFDEYLTAALTAAQINVMTSDQMRGLGSNLQFLTSQQAVAFNATNLAKIYSDDESSDFSYLTSSFLTNLPVTAVPTISVNQIKSILPSVIGELPSSFFARITPARLVAITASQMPVLALDSLNTLGFFNLDAMAALTGYQVSQLTYSQTRSITPAQMSVLQPSAIASLMLSFNVGYGELAILNNPVVLITLTSDQLHAFGERVYWLNYNLTSTQYDALTSEQAKALFNREGQNWYGIDANQIHAFTPADLLNFPLFNTDPTVYKAMTTAQISGFSSSSVRLIPGAVIRELSPEQFAALDLSSLNTVTNLGLVNVANDITIPQLKGLSSEKAATLTKELIASFDDNQLSALTIKNTLSTQQVESLTIAQKNVLVKVNLELEYTDEKGYSVKWNETANVHTTKKMKIFVTKKVKEVTSTEKCYSVSFSDKVFQLPNLEKGTLYIVYALYYDKQVNLKTSNVVNIDADGWPAPRPVIVCTRESKRSFRVSVNTPAEIISGALISYNTGFEAYGQSFEGPPPESSLYNGILSYLVEDDRIEGETVEVSMVIYTTILLSNESVTQRIRVASELSDTILVSLDGRPNPVTNLTSTYSNDVSDGLFMNVQWTPGQVYSNQEIVGYVLTVHNLTKQETVEIELDNVTSYSYYKGEEDDYGDRIKFSIIGFYYSADNENLRNDSDEVFSNELKLVGFSETAPCTISDSLRGNKLVRNINSISSRWYELTLTSMENNIIFVAYVRVDNNIITGVYDINNGYKNVLLPKDDRFGSPTANNVYPLNNGFNIYSDNLKTLVQNNPTNHFNIYSGRFLYYGNLSYRINRPVFTPINKPDIDIFPSVTFTIEPQESVGRISSEVMYVAKVYNSTNDHDLPVKTYYMYNDNTTYTTSIEDVELVNGYNIIYSPTVSFDNVYVSVTEIVANIVNNEIIDVVESNVSITDYAVFAPSSDKLLYTSTVTSTGTIMVEEGLEVAFTGTTNTSLDIDETSLFYHNEIYVNGIKIANNTSPIDFAFTYPLDLLNNNNTSTIFTYASLAFPVEKMSALFRALHGDLPMITFDRSESESIHLVNVTPNLNYRRTASMDIVNLYWSLHPNIPNKSDTLTQDIILTLNGVEQTLNSTPIVVDGDNYSTTISDLVSNDPYEITVTYKFNDYNLAEFSDSVVINRYSPDDVNIQDLIVSNINNRSALSCMFLLNKFDGFNLTGFETTVDVDGTSTSVDNTHGSFILPSDLTNVLTQLREAVNLTRTGITSVGALTFSNGYNFVSNKDIIDNLNTALATKYLENADKKDAVVNILNKLKFRVNMLNQTLKELSNATSERRSTVPSLSGDCQSIIDLIDQLTTSRNYWVHITNLPETFDRVFIRPYGTVSNSTNVSIQGLSTNFVADKVSTVVSNLTYDSSYGDGLVYFSWNNDCPETNNKCTQTLYAQWVDTNLRFNLVPDAITFLDGKYRSRAPLPPGYNFLFTVETSYTGYTNFHKTENNVQSYIKSDFFIDNILVSTALNSPNDTHFNFNMNKASGYTIEGFDLSISGKNTPTGSVTVINSTSDKYTLTVPSALSASMTTLKTQATTLNTLLPETSGAILDTSPYAVLLTEMAGTLTNMNYTLSYDALYQLYKEIIFRGNEIVKLATAIKTAVSSYTLTLLPTNIDKLIELITNFNLTRNQEIHTNMNYKFNTVTLIPKIKDLNQHIIYGIPLNVNADKINTSVFGLLYTTTGVSQKARVSWNSYISNTDDAFPKFLQTLTATYQNGTAASLTTTTPVCTVGPTYNTWYYDIDNLPNGNNMTFVIKSSYNKSTNFSYQGELDGANAIKGQAYDKTSIIITGMTKTPLSGGLLFRFDNVNLPTNMTLQGFSVKNESNVEYSNVSFTRTPDGIRQLQLTITGLVNDTKYTVKITPIVKDQNNINRDGTTYATLSNCYPRVMIDKNLIVTTDLLDNSTVRIRYTNTQVGGPYSSSLQYNFVIYRKKQSEPDSSYYGIVGGTLAVTNSTSPWSDNLSSANNGNTYVYKVTYTTRDAPNELDKANADLLLFNDGTVRNDFSVISSPLDLYDSPLLTLAVSLGKIILTLNMNGSAIDGLLLMQTSSIGSSSYSSNGSMNPVTVNYYDKNSIEPNGTLYNMATNIVNSASGDPKKGIWTIVMGDYTPITNVLVLAWNRGGAGSASISGPVLELETTSGKKISPYLEISAGPLSAAAVPLMVSGNATANISTTGMTSLTSSFTNNGIANPDDGSVYLQFSGMDFFYLNNNYGNSNTGIYLSTNGHIGFGSLPAGSNLSPSSSYSQISFDTSDLVDLGSCRSSVTTGKTSDIKYMRLVTKSRAFVDSATPNTVSRIYEIYLIRDNNYQYIQYNCSMKYKTNGYYDMSDGTKLQNFFGTSTPNAVAGSSYVLVSDLIGNNWSYFPNYKLNFL